MGNLVYTNKTNANAFVIISKITAGSN